MTTIRNLLNIIEDAEMTPSNIIDRVQTGDYRLECAVGDRKFTLQRRRPSTGEWLSGVKVHRSTALSAIKHLRHVPGTHVDFWVAANDLSEHTCNSSSSFLVEDEFVTEMGNLISDFTEIPGNITLWTRPQPEGLPRVKVYKNRDHVVTYSIGKTPEIVEKFPQLGSLERDEERETRKFISDFSSLLIQYVDGIITLPELKVEIQRERQKRLEESLTLLETTERLDVREIRNWTPQQWNQWLDNQIQNGEVYKADWTDAKQAISRQIDRAGEVSRNIYLDLDNAAREPYNDLYWDVPHGLTELNKAEKTAAKSPDGPFKKSVLDLVATYKPLKDKLEQLKPLIVTAQQRREVVKTQQATQRKSEEGSAEALVSALRENREIYVDAARQRALTFINRVKDKINSAGGLDKIAPTPNPKDDHTKYEEAKKKRTFYSMMDKISSEEYSDREARAAGDSYDAWVYKLVQKIGKPVTQADVTGDPWTGSTISVTTNDGEQQRWDTKMIINRSKLGKMFNQFPTRRVK